MSEAEASAGTAVPRPLGGEALDETPDTIGASLRLTDSQVSALAAHGERRKVASDEVLFRDGDSWADFFVVLAGKVAIVLGYGGPQEQLMVVNGPGR